MTFSATDLPVEFPNPLADLVKFLPPIEPKSRQFSPAQIEGLASMFGELLNGFFSSLEHTLEYDRNWRTTLFRADTDYDEAIEDRIRSSLESWADGAENILSEFDKLRQWGFHAAVADTLRSRLAEVRAMLSPDDEFFEGEGLDNLTSEALEEDERGETVEFRAMGE